MTGVDSIGRFSYADGFALLELYNIAQHFIFI